MSILNSPDCVQGDSRAEDKWADQWLLKINISSTDRVLFILRNFISRHILTDPDRSLYCGCVCTVATASYYSGASTFRENFRFQH